MQEKTSLKNTTKPLQEESQKSTAPKVLVVDDSTVDRMAIVRAIKDIKVDCVQAATSQEALDSLKNINQECICIFYGY